MIRQEFYVRHYWKVVVFYNVSYDLFSMVKGDLLEIEFSRENLEMLYREIKNGSIKAATCSNLERHTSILLFLPHLSQTDYLNSVVHEAEHVKQAMLEAYRVEDNGEPPAYTMGYIVGRMWVVVKDIVCGCH